MINTIAEARRVIEKAGGKVKPWSIGFYAVTMPEDRDPYGYSPRFMSRIDVIVFAQNLAENFGTDGGPVLVNK